MQLVKTIRMKLKEGKSPEEIARLFSAQAMILTPADEKDLVLQSQQAIDYAQQLRDTYEAWQYLRTLFLIYSRRDEWITLRVLGKIIENPSFYAEEKHNALSTMQKRLDRITNLPTGSAAVDKVEFTAYFHGLKAGVEENEKKYSDACSHYQEAANLYRSIGLAENQAWAQEQWNRVVTFLRPEDRPAFEMAHSADDSPNLAQPGDHRAERAAHQAELDRLESELAAARANSSQPAEQLSAMARERDERAQEVQSLHDTSAGLSNQVAQLTQQNSAQAAEIQQLHQDVAERDRLIAQLQQELEQARDATLEEKTARRNKPAVMGLTGDLPDIFQ